VVSVLARITFCGPARFLDGMKSDLEALSEAASTAPAAIAHPRIAAG
jgi:hypothetical protein